MERLYRPQYCSMNSASIALVKVSCVLSISNRYPVDVILINLTVLTKLFTPLTTGGRRRAAGSWLGVLCSIRVFSITKQKKKGFPDYRGYLGGGGRPSPAP